MKRGRKSGTSQQVDSAAELVKSTILLSRNLKQHLAVAAIATGQEQSAIMRDAIEERLEKMGCDLASPPQLPSLKRYQRSSALAAHG